MLEEFAGVADDLFVALRAIGGAEGHYVDAGHVVLQLRLGIFARDVACLRVDQRLDVLEGAHRHGIVRAEPARGQEAGQDHAGHPRALVATPAAVCRLAGSQVGDRPINELIPLLGIRPHLLIRLGGSAHAQGPQNSRKGGR